jgi:hypothetical protein
MREIIIQRVGNRSRRVTAATLILALGGVVLFVIVLSRAGVAAIAGQLANLGWGGFGVILALSGLRLAARSLAWTQCIDGPAPLRFRDAFTATLMGEALGKVTSFSSVLSEPAKAVAVAPRIPLGTALAAILVENIVYGASLALLVVAGATAFLLSYDMPLSLRWVSLGAIGLMLLVVLAAFVLLGTRATPVSGSLDRLGSLGAVPRLVARQAARVRRFEERIGTFARRHRERLLPLGLCELAYHVAGIAEVYVTLLLVGTAVAPTLLAALVLESAGRLVNVVFTFVPLRLGVDEAGSGVLATVLQLGTTPGVTLALVRKARILVWTAVGIALLLHRGLSIRRALEDARIATATLPDQAQD